MGEGKNPKMDALLLTGALCVIFALTADVLGIGESQAFGWKQWLLLIIGLGMIVMSKKRCAASKDQPAGNTPTPPSNQV